MPGSGRKELILLQESHAYECGKGCPCASILRSLSWSNQKGGTASTMDKLPAPRGMRMKATESRMQQRECNMRLSKGVSNPEELVF